MEPSHFRVHARPSTHVLLLYRARKKAQAKPLASALFLPVSHSQPVHCVYLQNILRTEHCFITSTTATLSLDQVQYCNTLLPGLVSPLYLPPYLSSYLPIMPQVFTQNCNVPRPVLAVLRAAIVWRNPRGRLGFPGPTQGEG